MAARKKGTFGEAARKAKAKKKAEKAPAPDLKRAVRKLALPSAKVGQKKGKLHNAPEPPQKKTATAFGKKANTPLLRSSHDRPGAKKMPIEHTIHTVLDEFRDEATSNRDLGDRFERLICRYLELDPIYADRFSNVWMWNEWPRKGAVGDTGIDIVAEERATGEFCAIQCKFYLPEHTLAKEDIDSFFTAAGKKLFTSCMIVSTTDKWSKNAEDALDNQSKPVSRLGVQHLEASPIDWSKFSLKRPQDLTVRKIKTAFPHQEAAIADVLAGFKTADRGKLIMACGTGKTFTALRIAERLAPSGHVLFLVPSLSLMSQSLREWTAEATRPLHCIAVCSDTNVGKREVKDDDEGADIRPHDLAFPATTSAREIVGQYQLLHAKGGKPSSARRMTVLFSTYQSIEAVSQAQKKGLPEFDLIICDEAHRTTGVTMSGEDASHFVKVHQDKFIQAKKRLYMTATPRLFSDDTKQRAKDESAELCSMDNVEQYGEELHRLGFGKAVGDGLLSDYKVLVLAVDQSYVAKAFQLQLASSDFEMKLDDATKIIGCWNGLAKRLGQDTESAADAQSDPAPMRRAVAFSRSIKDSKAFVDKFTRLVEADRAAHAEDSDSEPLLPCELEHVDGTYNALARGARLDWLKADAGERVCRVLSNARCLSEGVDVPALDAVLFLNPRKSQIDVVQSVGRVMRKAPGKKYGYIILPIGIPANMEPDEALDHNENYKVVWQVLQALRAHDDRFNATINQIELNEKRPSNIQVIGVGGRDEGSGQGGEGKRADKLKSKAADLQSAFNFPLEAWKDAIYARIVKKCGDRRHWERWAEDVAKIAEAHTTRISALVESGPARHKKAFADFLAGLRENINPSISEGDAVEMLSQHLITRPVFDALFGSSEFTQHNPVSKAMEKMLDALDDQALGEETKALGNFYDSVRQRASGIDNAASRQKIALELYETFFKIAFPKLAERLGIVYTPVEIVDFIVQSVEDVLRREFHSSVADKDVHVIDPFTGTGTFIQRLLQSGLIPAADLKRKYQHELHANEIVLLAYYIAAINIEETFHALEKAAKPYAEAKAAAGGEEYLPFDGIVLTDTFQLAETKGGLEEKMFPENNRRVRRQKASPIRVVIGNPPYSSKQESENDSNRNLEYAVLDGRIRSTYGERSVATNKNSLYDSYIRALRWASDRIADKGIIGFVTNGSFIDTSTMDGLRACLADEFSTIYVFNLRGNQRTSGETSRMEGGKIFGSGSRAGIAISLFIKNPAKRGKCELHYYDIGDYLTRDEKLGIITRFQSINGIHREKQWKRVRPNASHDWINQRDPAFETFESLGDKKDDGASTVFENYSQGILTSRDKWCYSFGRAAVVTNMRHMIAFYNEQVDCYARACVGKPKSELEELVNKVINTDPKKISWSSSLKQDLVRWRKASFRDSSIGIAVYRPFCKLVAYLDDAMVHRLAQFPKIFPAPGCANLVICITGVGNRLDFSTVMANAVPDVHMADSNGSSQCFPLYLYEKDEDKKRSKQVDLITKRQDGEIVNGYCRRSAITDAILADFRVAYEKKVSKEDIFYYVYGILHSPEYRTRFASDLKKMLPRIPLTQEMADFWRFSKAGRALARWHLEYETIDPYPVGEQKDAFSFDPKKDYLVTKMQFARKDKQQDKTTIIFNSHLTLTGIPLEAYEYVVNGKPAIEWIMERYQVTVDKDSQIKNDPNDWAREHDQPRYIVDLVKRIVRVSLETMKIVNALPALKERVASSAS